MLKTRLTDLLGLRYPVISAPMARMSGGRLAAAVSAAGGLGTFGGVALATPTGPEYVREQIATIRAQTDRPFGVGFITHWLSRAPENFEVVLEERVPVVLFSFADPRPWIGRARDAGAITICQVQTIDGARTAVSAGAHVLVAQGNESGGHTGALHLLPFLVRVIEMFPELPVVAAGGIANGRSLAAVLAAGAEGAWVGNRGDESVYTEVMDIVLTRMRGSPAWPTGIAARVHNNAFIRTWHGREDELRAQLDEVIPMYVEAAKRGDRDVVPVLFGRSADFVHAVRPAADVLTEMCAAAERHLRGRWNAD